MKKYWLIVFIVLFYSCVDNEFKNLNKTVDQELLLELVNSVRQEGCNCGDEPMPPVGVITWDNMLSESAQKHSDYMFKTENMSHTGKNNSKLEDRVDDTGYLWQYLGENIAFGFTSEEEVIKGWLESPSHCKNIMNKDFEEMGVARTGNYWTQVLGTKRNYN
jgi:uncharacterized protein YkwD